jgi:hypothetical protein
VRIDRRGQRGIEIAAQRVLLVVDDTGRDAVRPREFQPLRLRAI